MDGCCCYWWWWVFFCLLQTSLEAKKVIERDWRCGRCSRRISNTGRLLSAFAVFFAFSATKLCGSTHKCVQAGTRARDWPPHIELFWFEAWLNFCEASAYLTAFECIFRFSLLFSFPLVCSLGSVQFIVLPIWLRKRSRFNGYNYDNFTLHMPYQLISIGILMGYIFFDLYMTAHGSLSILLSFQLICGMPFCFYLWFRQFRRYNSSMYWELRKTRGIPAKTFPIQLVSAITSFTREMLFLCLVKIKFNLSKTSHSRSVKS